MRHTCSHDHCERELRSKLVTQSSSQPHSKASQCSSFVVGEIGKIGGMAGAFDKEVPERRTAVIPFGRVVDPEAIQHRNPLTAEWPFASVLRADDALRHPLVTILGSTRPGTRHYT